MLSMFSFFVLKHGSLCFWFFAIGNETVTRRFAEQFPLQNRQCLFTSFAIENEKIVTRHNSNWFHLLSSLDLLAIGSERWLTTCHTMAMVLTCQPRDSFVSQRNHRRSKLKTISALGARRWTQTDKSYLLYRVSILGNPVGFVSVSSKSWNCSGTEWETGGDSRRTLSAFPLRIFSRAWRSWRTGPGTTLRLRSCAVSRRSRKSTSADPTPPAPGNRRTTSKTSAPNGSETQRNWRNHFYSILHASLLFYRQSPPT